MATTARGIEYPASTDAPRVWEDMQALAESVDDALDVVAAMATAATAKYKKKAATETVTSSTTLQDDDDFVFTLAAGKVFHVELHVIATGASGGDVKVAWAVTGGVAALTNRHVEGPQIGTTDTTNTAVRTSGAHGLTTSIAYGTDGTNGSRIVEDFLVETTTAGTSGTLTCQWAQNTSSGTATGFNGSSFVIITELEDA